FLGAIELPRPSRKKNMWSSGPTPRFFVDKTSLIANYFATQSTCAKKFSPRLPLPRRANQRFHMIQVAFERLASRRRQPVFRFGRASLEGLLAHDVVRFFQFSRVHAQ